jgi:hypothetical protein
MAFRVEETHIPQKKKKKKKPEEDREGVVSEHD